VARRRRRTVFGEPVEVLLQELALCAGEPQVVGDMLHLGVAVPAVQGGALRRALLRAEATHLRRAADTLRGGPYVPQAPFARQSEAVLAVAREVSAVARAQQLSGTTVAERAVLFGVLAPPGDVSRAAPAS
jgi:hypothetical protein